MRESVHAEGLLPEVRIGSEEVKDLVRELDPNLGTGL